MTKKEGEILKKAILEAGYSIEDFWPLMGFKSRSGLTYHLGNNKVGYDIKEKAAKLLGRTVDEMYNQEDDKKIGHADKRMALLEDLVDSKNEIIRLKDGYLDNYKAFMVAKILRIEAYSQLQDRRIGEIYAKLFDQSDSDVKQAQDVEFEEILQSLKKQLDSDLKH